MLGCLEGRHAQARGQALTAWLKTGLLLLAQEQLLDHLRVKCAQHVRREFEAGELLWSFALGALMVGSEAMVEHGVVGRGYLLLTKFSGHHLLFERSN